MKKLFCLTLILLVMVSSLSACNFTQNISGSLAGDAESAPKVEEMMLALAENRTADAQALLHPQAAELSENGIAQISSYLAGREVSSMELKSIRVNSSTGTSGKTTQEQTAYQVTLTDGAVVYLNVVYLSNNVGTGFVSFQLVLGVV